MSSCVPIWISILCYLCRRFFTSNKVIFNEKPFSGNFSHFRAFYAEIHTQFHVFVQSLRSDNGKEYLSEQFQSFMLQNGIIHQTSCVDTPHNGVAKRKNRYLLEIANALLFQMHVPKQFWVNTVSIACFLINRMPSSNVGASTTTNGNLILIMEDSDLEGCKGVGSSKWNFWTSIKTLKELRT